MYSHSQRFYVVASVGAPREIRKVKLDLIPSLIQTHRHSTNERLDSNHIKINLKSELKEKPIYFRSLGLGLGSVFCIHLVVLW